MVTVIYGLTSSAHMFLASELNTDNNIFACTEGNEKFCGELAMSLIQLSNYDKELIERIVICSEFVSDILNSLIDNEFNIEKIFFFNHMSESLIPCIEQIISPIKTYDVLYAFYDLSCNLPCYDVTSFVVLAEQERISQNKKYICFVIVPDRSTSTIGINVYHSKNDASWRLEKIVKPLFYCLESYMATEELLVKEELERYNNFLDACFPKNYLTNNREKATSFKMIKNLAESGVILSRLTAPKQAKSIVEKYIESQANGRKVITVTLREYWANPEHRNNRIEDWVLFLNELDKSVYFPVVIRDTYHCTDKFPYELPGVDFFPLASIDLHIRLALYQQAYVNLGVENGPMYPISYLKGARSITFRQINENIPNLAQRTNTMHGFEFGKNHYFYDNKFQITVWSDDNFEIISEQFYSLVENIESNGEITHV